MQAGPDRPATSISSASRGTRGFSTIAANIWRGVPFVAITLLAGLQTISPSYYEAASLDGATPLAAVPLRHAAAADADHRRRDDVLGAVHVHRLPADLRADARRPAQRDAPDGDAVVPARDLRAAASAKARRSRSRWCRSCSRRSCSATSACSAARGSREGRQMTDAPSTATPADDRHAGHGLPRVAAAQARHGLPAAGRVPDRAAVPVLLDGDHLVQAERGAAVARGQSVLGDQPDARALQEAAVRHRLSRLAVEHDAGLGRRRRSSRSSAACSPPTRSSGCASAARATSA